MGQPRWLGFARSFAKVAVKWGVVGLLSVVLFVSGIMVADASHNFSDVPTGAFYHNAVEWVFNRAITAGCAAGLYCPDNAVTRGTMAVFLRALGVALTPQILTGFGSGPVDPDANPVVCTTFDYTPSFPKLALARAYISLFTNSGLLANLTIEVSTNGGSTWSLVDGQEVAGTSGPVPTANTWIQMTQFGHLSLSPGTTYRFGARAHRQADPAGYTADASQSKCRIYVEIFNRNPDIPPLVPAPPGR